MILQKLRHHKKIHGQKPLSARAFAFYIKVNTSMQLILQKSLKIRTEIGDKFGISSSLNGIGMMYSVLKDLKSLEYFNRTLKINGNSAIIKQLLTSSTINIGSCYYELKEYEKGTLLDQ
jgi:hypothetical protein